MIKRTNLGIITTPREDNNQLIIIKKIISESKKYNMNTIFFSGLALKSNDLTSKQHNTIYELITQNDIDFIITFSETLYKGLTRKEIHNFNSKFKNIPIISLNYKINNVNNININNDNINELFKLVINLLNTENDLPDNTSSIEKYNDEEFEKNYIKTISAMENIMFANSVNELINIINQNYQNLNLKSWYVVFYKNKQYIKQDLVWKKPEHAKIIFMNDRHDNIKLNHTVVPFKTNTLLPIGLPSINETYSLYVKPLFYREEQFGYIVFEVDTTNISFCETFSVILNVSVMNALLFEDQKTKKLTIAQQLKEINFYNKRLKNISISDELTGLYNRKGFMKYSEEKLNISRDLHQSGVLFFLDIDYLKNINEKYGHEEGDFAVVIAGQIIQNSFRGTDLKGRIGGDEFLILATDIPDNFINFIKNHIEEKTAFFNQSLNKPYKIKLNIGYVNFTENDKRTIDELMLIANKTVFNKE